MWLLPSARSLPSSYCLAARDRVGDQAQVRDAAVLAAGEQADSQMRRIQPRQRNLRPALSLSLSDMWRQQLGWAVDDCFARRAATELVITACEKHSPAVGDVAPLLRHGCSNGRVAIPPPGCGSGPQPPLLTAERVAGAHD